MIYDLASNPETLYILMSGRVAMETEIEIDETNRFPIGRSRWEVQTTKRKVFYEIREVVENEVFGH